MALSIIAVGGHGEVGRNCTAIDVDGDIFLFDLGLHLENYVALNDEDEGTLSTSRLIREQAVPDISVLDSGRVKAVLISHAHLDHVGAIPYLSNSFDADIYGTPFTMNIAQRICEDKGLELRNELVACPYRNIIPLTDKVSVEFIEVTHSTPQSAAIALHTSHGVILYLNDFKLDKDPYVGGVTDLERMAQLKPKALIMDTLYASLNESCPGEMHAKELLEKALLSRNLKGRQILVTTFSSQIARIKILVEIAQQMNRKVMIVGRSMTRYLSAAQDEGITNLIEEHEVVKYGSKVRKALAKISHFQDYLFIVTGGMAEPNAVLSRIIDEEMIPLRRRDLIIFSNKVIPLPSIIEGRQRLERKLQERGFEVLKDLHVSGHGAAKDMEEVLEKVKPEIVVAVHGEELARQDFASLAKRLDSQAVLLRNGEHLDL